MVRRDARRRLLADVKSASGFTLIELMIVIALSSVLAGMGVVQYKNGVQHTAESVLRTDLFRMRDAIDQYYADKNKYPESLETLVSDHYLRAIPKDPFTQATDWQTVPADAEPGSTSAVAGIYNVKSNSQDAALDGGRYADW